MNCRHCILLFLVSSLGLLTSCDLNAQITQLIPGIEGTISPTKASGTEFVVGEVVTTENGVLVRASFGEVTETKVLSNGVQIFGAFYD